MPTRGLSDGLLLSFWMATKDRLSQRELAQVLGVNFNSLHGKVFREQTRQEEEAKLNSKRSKTYPPVGLSAAVFDIETTSFKAGGVNDHLVCMCLLPLGSNDMQTYQMEFKDNRDDRQLLARIQKALYQYDILIGHNILAFDLGFLRSRVAYHGMPWDERRFLVYDTYQAARRIGLKSERKSLAFIGDFFRIDIAKTSILPVAWSMIDSPDATEFGDAIEEIVDHCARDVRLNREVFYALWPQDKSMVGLPAYKK